MDSPSSAEYWSEVETWPRDRIAEFQLAALRRQLAYVGANSAYYKAAWAGIGFEPGDLRSLDDLRSLPVVRKADYVADLAERGPWGSMLAVHPEDVARVHFSSGTTSSPAPVCWTRQDLDRWADLYARFAYSQGVRRTDVYQALFGFAWFVGGLGVTAAYTKIGCTVIPGGSGDTERQIDVMARYGTTAVSGTPSFMLHLAETAERLGRPVTGNRVRRIQVGGEPGGGIPETRALIEERWDAKVFDGYGSLEFQPIAWECERQAGGHFAEDFVHAEVVDAETGAPVPDGSPGVLVLTHLDKQASPFVRWWTGDVVVRDPDPCACGRTHGRLRGGVLGRADDMLVVRGVNFFPSSVESLVRSTPGATGEYLIVIDEDVVDRATGYLTGVKVRLETEDGAAESAVDRLAHAIRAELTVRAVVEPVPSGSLARSTHKAKRLVREI
ncbi:phenylacetate--CoA ligase family protein [Nonomuraea sp. C10]|uniref:phenylacetate--CoA ligase family protein n=1 Tax=Nonomuraea sp. C10 TaxID=2600577 RepID=UPI0011CEAB27|nr:AMP-binding protein [Nonomuraea sp. C10]TXK38952.1 phenylacetate--CoA ligase [Nonomuraea sp. C10]